METEADVNPGARRPTSSRALAIIGATVIGAILLALASFGADDPDANDAPAAGGTINAASSTAAATAPAATERSTTPAPPTTSPDSSPTTSSGDDVTTPAPTAVTPTAVPTTEPTPEPVAVESILVAGDSMARSLFPPVQEALETDTTEVRLEWVIGTLVGDEWDKWLRIFDVDPPDVVVAHFMPWESATVQQGTVIDTNDPDWATEYRTDWVERWLDLASGSGSRIVWVTPPLAADAERSAEHQEVGAIWSATIEDRNDSLPDDDPRRITVIDSVALSAGPDGEFVAIDDTVDPPERLFNTDGVHWCPAGAARLSDRLIEEFTSLGLATASDRTPPWQTAAWATDPESVRASEPNFGDGFAYPPGECPDPNP